MKEIQLSHFDSGAQYQILLNYTDTLIVLGSCNCKLQHVFNAMAIINVTLMSDIVRTTIYSDRRRRRLMIELSRKFLWIVLLLCVFMSHKNPNIAFKHVQRSIF